MHWMINSGKIKVTLLLASVFWFTINYLPEKHGKNENILAVKKFMVCDIFVFLFMKKLVVNDSLIVVCVCAFKL